MLFCCRKVNAKDICTYCNQSMYTDEKFILDDMNINCHARCFKCGVCNTSLGNLRAGDSLWVYQCAIHCASCFGVTKNKWMRWNSSHWRSELMKEMMANVIKLPIHWLDMDTGHSIYGGGLLSDRVWGLFIVLIDIYILIQLPILIGLF